MVYRAALIGCGSIGAGRNDLPPSKNVSTHAGAYVACAKTEIVAVCDTDLPKAKQCATKWKAASAYGEADLLLKERAPEIVSVCTPNPTHAAILEQVLRTPSVRAVLTEKPLALELARAEELVRLARQKNVVLAVNYSRRYSEGHARVREILRSEGIGRVQTLVGHYTKGILHNGTHWLDLARWFVGEIDQVQGFHPRSESEGDCQLDATLHFQSGATGFLSGLDADAYSLFEMDILGSRGRIRLLDSGHRIERFEVADSPHYPGYKTLRSTGQEDGGMDDLLLHAVNDLVDCLESGREPRCSGEEALRSLRAGISLMASAQESRPISLESGP